jgi:hypothetical protein
MMQYLSQTLMWVAALTLLAIAVRQHFDVSWRTDRCGCVGVYSLGFSAAYTISHMAKGLQVHHSTTLLIAAFALWLACRTLSKRWPSGPFGKTDAAPLGPQ